MTNRNVSKMILCLGTIISLAAAVVLILFKADKEYIITCFGFVTGFSSSMFTYINSSKETNGGNNGKEDPTPTSGLTTLTIPK